MFQPDSLLTRKQEVKTLSVTFIIVFLWLICLQDCQKVSYQTGKVPDLTSFWRLSCSTIHGRIDQVNQLLELDYQKRGGARYTALDKWTNQLNSLNQAIVSKLTWCSPGDEQNGTFEDVRKDWGAASALMARTRVMAPVLRWLQVYGDCTDPENLLKVFILSPWEEIAESSPLFVSWADSSMRCRQTPHFCKKS